MSSSTISSPSVASFAKPTKASSSRIMPPKSRCAQTPNPLPSTQRIQSSAMTNISKLRNPSLLAPSTIASKPRTQSIISSSSSATNNQIRQSQIQPPRLSINNFNSNHRQSQSSIKPVNGITTATTNSFNKPTSVSAAPKGLAKFANPIECQRQFAALSTKIKTLEETITDKSSTIENLEKQLSYATNTGLGYALTAQYFAKVLKLDLNENLVQEKNNLENKVEILLSTQAKHDKTIKELKEQHYQELQLEIDLSIELKNTIEQTNLDHLKQIEELERLHKNQVDGLIKDHLQSKTELEDTINSLSEDYNTRCQELDCLRKTHDGLVERYSKLEETLTKDNDARVRYSQEKIAQLQKEVESFNSVLELRTERMHQLEKDSLRLLEVNSELKAHKDTIKSLKQQLESMTAALDRKREQYENLIVEHEKVKQELKREHIERRKMTIKSEQLEYALNESSNESSIFNSPNRNNTTVILASSAPTSTPMKFDD